MLSKPQEAAYAAFRKEVRGRPYEKNNVSLARSAIDFCTQQKEDLSSLFCSEMCAEAFQRMKLLSEEKPSSEYTPADFAKGLKKFLGKLYYIK